MSEPPCPFCRIAAGEVAAEVVHQGPRVVAFADLHPQAPHHLLVIPREHIPTLNHLSPEHNDLVGEMFQVAQALARERGFADSGYRTVFNCNPQAGQSVYHMHLHVLGGRPMAWPPG